MRTECFSKAKAKAKAKAEAIHCLGGRGAKTQKPAAVATGEVGFQASELPVGQTG